MEIQSISDGKGGYMKRYTARINIVVKNEDLWKRLAKVDISKYKLGAKFGEELFKGIGTSFYLEKKWFVSDKALKSLVISIRKRLGSDAIIIADLKDTDKVTGAEKNYIVYSLNEVAEDAVINTEDHRKSTIRDVETWFKATGYNLTAKDYYFFAMFPGANFDKIRKRLASNVNIDDFKFTADKNGDLVITKYLGSAKDLFVPAFEPKGGRIVEIRDGAFARTGVSSVVIPYGYTKIGKNAFAECKYLSRVLIADSVKKIGKGAFAECTSLQSIRIPSSIKKIPDEAFYNCESLLRVLIPANVRLIGNAAFAYCDNLEKVKFSRGNRVIGNSAFLACEGLTEVELPQGLLCIGGEAFADCINLDKLRAPANYGWIGEEAFVNCGERFVILAKKGSKAYEYAVNRRLPIKAV